MLQDFSELNGTPTTFHEKDIEGHFQTSDHLRGVVFWPKDWPTTLTKVDGKTFENVSLSKTRFYRVTFKECTFIDCLFVGTEFDEVEFHRCSFENCNFFKTDFKRCYVDPLTIKIDAQYKKTRSNVFVTLFQRLLDNSREQHQADFAESADIRFRQWKRAQLGWDRSQGHITNWQYKLKWFWSSTYEFTCGFGYKPWRFYGCTIFVFILISMANWIFLKSSMVISGTSQHPETFIDCVYYTFSMLTVLGFSTILPQTDAAKLITVAEVLGAVGWLSILTALLVKRFIR